MLPLALGLLWVGWNEFLFLCDDAYITFRHISNRQLGFGYVWNAPPFRPVEGYSNFLWMVLLDLVWSFLKLEPPEVANVLSLGLSAVTVWRVWRWAGPGWLRAGLALLFTLSNRTFLCWTSSGLETALFGLLMLLWVEALWTGAPVRRGTRAHTHAALWASLLALTRPDGALPWAATIALGLWPAAASGYTAGESALRGARRGEMLKAAGALLLPLVHLAWRRATYGEWLPNTFYAKQVRPWPEMGATYLASFGLEYGYWLLAAGLLVWAAWRWRPGWTSWFTSPLLERAAVVATLVLHLGYYVVFVGGDHFEYRVLAHLVPLLSLAWASWLTVGVRSWAPRAALLVVGLWVSLPIPWAHHLLSRELTTRKDTNFLFVKVEPVLGHWLGPLARWFDGLQGELIPHSVGLRHQEHRVFGEEQRRHFPVRHVVDPKDAGIPVMVWNTVGVPGWVLPNVAFIDLYGLNDYVVARTPVPPASFRRMAHERSPPPGYGDCFRGNAAVDFSTGRSFLHPRERPLTADDVRACERRYAEQLGLTPPP